MNLSSVHILLAILSEKWALVSADVDIGDELIETD